MRRKSRQRAERNPDTISRLGWRRIVNPYPPLDILSDDQIEAIHLASLDVLRDAGVKFFSSRARKIFQSIGAEVDHAEQMVRFDPELVINTIKTIPPSFQVSARNSERSVEFGGRNINFATVGGPSFVSDLDRGRRAGTMSDLKDFFKLVHQLSLIHI